MSGIIFWNVSGQDAKCGPITLAPNENTRTRKGREDRVKELLLLASPLVQIQSDEE